MGAVVWSGSLVEWDPGWWPATPISFFEDSKIGNPLF